MIEIYCGDGKGKTTASVGLAVRAAGHNMPVIFAQFMKDDSSGEISVLKELPQIQVMHTEVFYGFFRNMDALQKEEMKRAYTRLLEQIEGKALASKGNFLLIVLDEILHVCNMGLLEERLLCQFLDNCPAHIEVVLTGRNPSEELLNRADYISEIQKIKHPFDRGIAARKGIEL